LTEEGWRQASSPSFQEASTVGSNIMRTFGAVCFSLLLSAVPATASDQNFKEELGKVASAYEQNFNKKDAAGITSLFTKNYLRVTETGVVADNTKYYEDTFKAGLNHLEIKTNEVQPLSENMAILTGEAHVTGTSAKGDPLEAAVIWTSLDVRENGQWKIRMLTSLPKPPPQPQQAAK
jgi:ketosteroid isomerase-like protein